MNLESIRAAAALALAALALACGGGDSPPATPAAGPSAPAVEAPAPVTTHEPAPELPEGHPPIGGSGPPSSVVAPPPGSGTGAAGLSWDAPDGWVEEPPSSEMRRAQYRVPGPGGDGVCVVFYFGPGQGGDPMSNAARWASQFKQPDGSDSLAAMTTREIEVSGMAVMLVEIRGTYTNPMVSADEMSDYMLLGAVARGPDANWFFKFTGPEATVEAQRAAFDGLARSLRPGAS